MLVLREVKRVFTRTVLQSILIGTMHCTNDWSMIFLKISKERLWDEELNYNNNPNRRMVL